MKDEYLDSKASQNNGTRMPENCREAVSLILHYGRSTIRTPTAFKDNECSKMYS